jgi:hypothetical protein
VHLTSSVKKIIVWRFAISIALCVTFFSLFLVKEENILFSDYTSFATGSLIVRDGVGEKLYDLQTQKEYQKKLLTGYSDDRFLPYLYLPFYSLLFLPFTNISLFSAYRILALIIVGLIFYCYHLSTKLFKVFGRITVSPLMFFAFLPVTLSVVEIQIAPLVMVIFIFIYKFLKSEEETKAGAMTGLLLLKPQLLLILPFLFVLTKNRRDFFKGLLITVIPLLALSMIIAGADFVPSYLKILRATDSPLFMNRAENKHTFYALLVTYFPKVFSNKSLAYFTNFAGYSMFLTAIYWRRKKLGFDLFFAISILTAVVFAIHIFTHDYLVVYLSIILLMTQIDKKVGAGYNKLIKSVQVILFLLPLTVLYGFAPISSVILLGIIVILMNLDPKGIKLYAKK